MAYIKGNTILAADINAMLATVRSVYGTGTGNFGYGQTAITQNDVVAGQAIDADEWTNLRAMVEVCAVHQGTAIATLPTTGQFTAGQTVFAHEADAPSSNAKDLNSFVAAISTNRLTAAAGSMTLTSGAHTVTRATTWNASIATTIDVGFGSENAARYYFNAGGQIRIRGGHPTGGGSQDVNWRTILTSALGTLTINASSVSITGSSTGAVATTHGFYNMTTSPVTIFNGVNIGSGAYASNDLTITAQVLNRVGTNGGNGNGIRFVITMNDEHTGFEDNVSSGTNIAFDHYRPNLALSGMATPSYTTVSGF
jgi:hypothetical protein